MASNQILRALRRGWRLLAVFAAVGLILGAASASLTNPPEERERSGIYAASVILRVDGELSIPVPAATQYLSDPAVAEQVAVEIGGDPLVLVRHVVGTANPQLNTIAITSVDVDATRAEQLANSFGAAFSSHLLGIEVQKSDQSIAVATERSSDLYVQVLAQQDLISAAAPADRPILQAQMEPLLRQYTQAEEQRRAAEARSTQSLITTEREATAEPITRDNFDAYVQRITGSSSRQGKNDPAPSPGALTLADALEPSAPPIPPNPLTRGLAGMGLGFVAGILLLLVLDRIDPRLRTKEQTELVCGYPVVAEIPPLTRRQRLGTDVLVLDEPLSRSAEAYRVLRSAILFAASADNPTADHPTPPQVLLVTSPGPSEGKTTTTANLAAVMAEAGYSVLVINCDFRRPRIKDYLGGPDDDRRVTDTRIPHVHLVDHVEDDEQLTNPAAMAAAQRRVIRSARDLFDVVLLDTAPLLTTNDASELLPLADMVVLVAAAGRTNAEAATRAAELLERRRAKVLGITLIGVNDLPAARYYYYAADGTDGAAGVSATPAEQEESAENLGEELRRLSDTRPPAAKG